jgi:integrase
VPILGVATETKTVLYAMSTKIRVRHQGITLDITKEREGRYIVPDYSSGKRRRHVRTTEAEARDKAKQICELMASGQKDLLDLSPHESEIRGAFDSLPPGIRLGRAVDIVRDCCQLLEPEEIVAACRYWRDNRPNRQLIHKEVNQAVPEFLERREKKVSERRYRADDSYLGAFESKFGSRFLHEISKIEIRDWADGKGWGAKTKNDALGLVRQLYNDAIERNYTIDNPARIKREPVGGGDVEIFMPEQVQRILNSVEDRLKPFFAILFFSGLRKEEASRLSVAQVHQGLESGEIFLPGSFAKTKRSRSVSVCDNLRVWLVRYLPADGPLLPVERRSMERLDELPGYAARKSGVPWIRNGPRHSFGSYFLRLTGDPAETAKQMGNSLTQLDRHYNSRAKGVTPETAKRYFAILPPTEADNLIPMPKQEAEAEPRPAAPAAGMIPSRQ